MAFPHVLTYADIMAETMLTTQEAAELLGVTDRMVRYLATPRLPHVRAGRAMLYKTADVEALQERRSRQAAGGSTNGDGASHDHYDDHPEANGLA